MVSRSLDPCVDWFMSGRLQKRTQRIGGADIRHQPLPGTFSAVAILGYSIAYCRNDWVFWILCAFCGSFWTLPFTLKLVRNLYRPALFSFCVLTASASSDRSSNGGVSSHSCRGS